MIAERATGMILTLFHPMNKWTTHALYTAEVIASGGICYIMWLGYT